MILPHGPIYHFIISTEELGHRKCLNFMLDRTCIHWSFMSKMLYFADLQFCETQ